MSRDSGVWAMTRDTGASAMSRDSGVWAMTRDTGAPERGAGNSRIVRFGFVTVAVCSAVAFGLPAIVGRWPFARLPFAYFLIQVTAVKLLGDLVYFTVSPRYREIAHLDDYLTNDFFTFYRFALPLAMVQAYLRATGRVPLALAGLWPTPLLATVLYLANRWLIEQAQDKRREQRGGVPIVGQRS